jgi:hypothetical protein
VRGDGARAMVRGMDKMKKLRLLGGLGTAAVTFLCWACGGGGEASQGTTVKQEPSAAPSAVAPVVTNHVLVPGPNGKIFSGRVSEPIDISSVAHSKGHAFRAQKSSFEGVGGNATVQVERSGEIHFKVASKPELGMSFSTDRVGRDGENTTSERVTFQVVNGGGLEIGRGRVVEKIQNTDDGTQQSWRFTEKPRGNGDLEVDVAVRNAPSQVSDDLDGLKFALKGAPGVIRYSHGTWIDGDGRRTKVGGVQSNSCS